MKHVTAANLKDIESPTIYKQLITKDASYISKARGLVAIKNYVFKNGKKDTVIFFTKKSNDAKDAFKELKAGKYTGNQLLYGQCEVTKAEGNVRQLKIKVLDGGLSNEALQKEGAEVFSKLAVTPQVGDFKIEEKEEKEEESPTESIEKSSATAETKPVSASGNSIGGSVGRGGKNEKNDVIRVQELLNKRGAKLVVDGACGKITIATIEALQKKMGMTTPDGRIDPNGKTWKVLVGGNAEKPSPETPPAVPPTAPAAGNIEKGPVPSDFVRMKDKDVTAELSKAAVFYLKQFCATYPAGKRDPHYGEFIRFTTSTGLECLAHFEVHTVYGADLKKAQVPHPSIGLFKRKQ